MGRARPKLYVIAISAPSAAVEVALELKSIDYDRVELPTLSQVLIGPLLYGGTTVPGMRLDGERLVGSRTILRRLDTLVPEPPLLPASGSDAYAEVLEAERWGDEVLQSVLRALFDVAFVSKPAAAESYLGNAKIQLPHAVLAPVLPLSVRLVALRNRTRDRAVSSIGLLGLLDRVDAWIAEGVLGGEQPNAADLQIGSSIRSLMTMADVRPAIEGRPSAALTRYFPPMPGEIEAGALTGEWLAGTSSG
jgi:glutathione S-transferase